MLHNFENSFVNLELLLFHDVQCFCNILVEVTKRLVSCCNPNGCYITTPSKTTLNSWRSNILLLYLFIDIFVVVLFLHYDPILFKICKVICSVCFSSLFSVFSFGCMLSLFFCDSFLPPVSGCVVFPSLVSTLFSICLVVFCFALFSFGNN